MSEPAQPPIPVTVIGGYLGAGKTTLVNHLLRNANGLRIAVLVNDFGALQIDADLIEAADGDTISLANGCICCSLAGGLVEAMLGILDRPQPPEWVVIETSGVSDPVAAAQYAHLPGFRLDGVIVVADAETVRRRSIDRHVGRHVLQQLRGADLLLLNKTDLITTDQRNDLRQWLADIAPDSRVVETVGARLPVAALLGGSHVAFDRQSHDEHFDAHRTWSFSDAHAIDGGRFRATVAALPASIVRGKGVLHLVEQPEVAHVFQLVGARWSIVRGSPWVPADRVTRLVLIGLPDHSDHSDYSDHSDVEAVDRMLQELHVDRQRSDPPDEELA